MNKTLKDIRIELAEAMIRLYLEASGLTEEETYDPERNFWQWKHGSATIEVFVQSVNVGDDQTREYLRIFSYLADIPAISKKGREEYMLHLLEMNDKNLGVKLTVMKGTNKVYATYERDIVGMDYSELSTCIADLEWWADKLDDDLKSIYN